MGTSRVPEALHQSTRRSLPLPPSFSCMHNETRARNLHPTTPLKLRLPAPLPRISQLGPESQTSVRMGPCPQGIQTTSYTVFPRQVGGAQGLWALVRRGRPVESAVAKVVPFLPEGAAPSLSISDTSGLWPELLQQMPPSPPDPGQNLDCWPRELGLKLEKLQTQMNR